MIFSSYSFLFLFFPVVFIGFHLLRKTRKIFLIKLWLVAASLCFYGVGEPTFLLIFVLSILLNYGIVFLLDRCDRLALRRFLLLLAVLWNVGLLIYFKYTNFLLENINLLFRTHFPEISVLLPIGISFFTFQILAYTITCYRRDCSLASFLDYTVFITFFPQLIVGPVVKQEELLPQVEGERLLSFSPVFLGRGIMLFSLGCAKKVLLANTMITFATSFYGGDVTLVSSFEAWIGVLCYTFAYYFDFSGYIDMARGLGCLFGVTLPANFDSPYRARDFADFWRRWNITISRFFYECIFDNVFRFGDGIPKLILAVMATFAVSGIWHGAGWHYIAWGLANGVLVCIANIRVLRQSKPLPGGLAIALTFLIGAIIRVLFDSNGMTQAILVYQRMFDFGELIHLRTLLHTALQFTAAHPAVMVTLLLSAVLCFFFPNTNRIAEKESFSPRDAVVSGVCLGASLLFMTQVTTFLYFNF